MLGGLVAVLSIFLVGQTLAADESLFPHAAPSEELSRDEVLAKLDKVSYDKDELVTPLVLDVLYKAKDKDSSKLDSGLTVADLIAQNNVQTSSCTREALKKRDIIANQVEFTPRQNGFKLALRAYLLDALAATARFCVVHQKEVIEAGLNDQEWMDKLKLACQFDGFDNYFESGEIDDEYWAETIAYHGFSTNIGRFVETDRLKYL